MAGTGPADLHELALEYLQACVEALDTIPGSPSLGPGVVGSPDRVFVAPGTPAADCCPQLTVHAVPLTEGAQAPGPSRASTMRVNRVTLVATLFRCVASPDGNGNPPSADEQEEVSVQVNADRWALWNYVWNKVRADLLFTRCGDVTGWSLDQIPPSGLCVGTVLRVTVQLDGYETVFGT
jgi:hypothetical protein